MSDVNCSMLLNISHNFVVYYHEVTVRLGVTDNELSVRARGGGSTLHRAREMGDAVKLTIVHLTVVHLTVVQLI